MVPYKDQDNIRTFSSDVDPMSLIWHKDQEDRTIEILEGEGWKLQFDNCLPFDLIKGNHIFIARYKIHRVLKGTTPLIINIKNGRIKDI